MAPEETSIYCEQCGSAVRSDDEASEVHYCAQCELFTCRGCWGTSELRCWACEASPLVVGETRERIQKARQVLKRLEAFRPQLDAATARATPRGTPGLDARLEVMRANATAEYALAILDASRSAAAQKLRTEIQIERMRAAATYDLRTAHSPGGQRGLLRMPAYRPTLRIPRLAKRVAWPRHGLAMTAVPAAAIVALAIGGALLATLNRSGTADVGLGRATPPVASTPEGAVAGNRSDTPQPAPTAHPRVATASPVTFDGLIMGRGLPDAIQSLIQGGTAEVAPIPNAVDRSLRLVSSSDGTPARFCHPLPAKSGAVKMAADILAPQAAPARVVVRFGDGHDAAEVGIAISAGGELAVVPGGRVIGQITADEWLKLELYLGDTGALSIATRSEYGSSGTEAEVALPSAWPKAEASLCISTPPTAGGEVYVNSVLIE